MSPEEQRKAFIAQEKSRLEAEEREKRLLHDRTVGGPRELRPSRDFVEKITGPLRSQGEIARLAEQRADTQMRQAEREKTDREQFAKSVEAHNKRLEQKQERAKDYWTKPSPSEQRQQQQTRDYWHERAKQPAQEKAPKREKDWDRDR